MVQNAAAQKGSNRPYTLSFVLERLENRQLLAVAVTPGLLDPLLVPKFANPMPNALDSSFIYQPTTAGGSHYDVGVYPITQDLGLGLDPQTDLPLMTPLYGYGTSAETATYPGRTFVANSGSPISVTWRNELWETPGITPLSLDDYVVRTFDSLGNEVSAVDFSLFEPMGPPQLGIPIVTHLHGGHTESASDGLPKQWYTPPVDAQGEPLEVGPGYVKDDYTYDNSQPSATLWYHDHAMAITRLNAYAGLAGFYFVRDQFDTGDANNAWGLPYGAYEIPIAIQDKMFTTSGELFFPTMSARDPDTDMDVDPSTTPEMFGDTIVVNGKAWPFLNVEPRKYRFHLLNGSDSRFYNFFLPGAHGKNVPIVQIAGDQGMFDAPVTLNSLVLGPGERADVIIDFAGLAGQKLVLRNNAKTPYPKGETVDPRTTGQIMQFRVGSVITQPDNPLPTVLRGASGEPATIAPLVPSTDPTTGKPEVRKLGLFEVTDEYGRITPMLGTVGTATDGPKPFLSPATETPILNSTEIWEIYNTTVDAHPIHLHLVAFQLIDRQKIKFAIDPTTNGVVPGSIRFNGKPIAPDANEGGWEDTIIMNPGQVTRIIAKFDRPGEYVWHCHILSHEEHDMMRPFVVIDPAASPAVLTGTVMLRAPQPSVGSSGLFNRTSPHLRAGQLLDDTANLQTGSEGLI